MTNSKTFADYDDMPDDTDEEEGAKNVCSGQLLRSRWQYFRCWPGVPRMAELRTSGVLYISGNHYFSTLAVDVARFGEGVLRQLDTDQSGRAHWMVRNPRTQIWEHLEAPNAEEARWWENAFADILCLGALARDPTTAYKGFFRKYHEIQATVSLQQNNAEQWPIEISSSGTEDCTGELENWKFRLLSLKADGEITYFSHREHLEISIGDAMDPDFSIRRLQSPGRTLSHLVVFELPAPGAGNEMDRWAGTVEDCEAFEASMQAIRRRENLDSIHFANRVRGTTSGAAF